MFVKTKMIIPKTPKNTNKLKKEECGKTKPLETIELSKL